MWNKIAWLTIAIVVVIGIVQAVVYLPQLPEKVASHFGIDGNPDSWMSKTAFFVSYLLIQIAVGGGLIGLGKLIQIAPRDLMNTPHKEFWMADENRPKFNRLNELALTGVASITMAFLAFGFQLVILANLGKMKVSNTSLVLGIVGYFAILVIILIAFFVSLNRVDSRER